MKWRVMLMLSSNLSYEHPEWITWFLNKQTAIGQMLFRKQIEICTGGEEVLTWCEKVLEKCPFRHWKLHSWFRDTCSSTHERCVHVQVHMKDPCTAENKQWLTTPFFHLCSINPSSTQHRIADFMGTLPLPVLCEGAALIVSTTSALLEETARGGWIM